MVGMFPCHVQGPGFTPWGKETLNVNTQAKSKIKAGSWWLLATEEAKIRRIEV
jgi:hypothetical protein